MQKIGIGYEDYKEFIDGDMYYVDKTLFVRDILYKGGKVTFIIRPRRFGKTLALSMLQTFFEIESDSEGNRIDKSRYFSGKKVMDTGSEVLSKMGEYPVIRLSLKSAKQPSFYAAFIALREEIVNECIRHNYVLQSDEIDPDIKRAYLTIKSGITDWEQKSKSFTSKEDRDIAFAEEIGKYATAIKTLSAVLKAYHKKNVIILLDEYDVPLENAYYNGFYDEMVAFIRSLFESALKTNDALEFAVVTGCLRISRESIFTGLNNLEVNSIRSKDFGEYFGFTHDEVENMLDAYGLKQNAEVVNTWYDGYLFGDTPVYNPWSVNKYVKEHLEAPDRFPEPYWSNTSSNSIIKDLVENADNSVKEELDKLITGGTIEKQIHEDITYEDIYKNEENLWNFLFFTGYMKKVSERIIGDDIFVTMTIPNVEIKSIYRNQIMDWFTGKVKETDFEPLYAAIKAKETKAIEDFIRSLLAKSISYFDGQESFYHGFFLSLLYGMPGYIPKSNREEGEGRPDVLLLPDRATDPAYIFEIKTRKKYNEMSAGLQQACDQIKDKKYEEGVLQDGYNGVVSFGICFCKKDCVVGVL